MKNQLIETLMIFVLGIVAFIVIVFTITSIYAFIQYDMGVYAHVYGWFIPSEQILVRLGLLLWFFISLILAGASSKMNGK